MKYALGILKPDCLKRGLEKKVFEIIERSSLKLILKKRLRFTKQDVEYIYEHYKKNDYFDSLIDVMTSGDSIAYIVEGDGDVIRRLNSITGHTYPKYAKKGTIRELGIDIRYNLAHSTRNIQNFWKEAKHIFSKEELCTLDLEEVNRESEKLS